MTFAEATKQRLDVTFLTTLQQAEQRAAAIKSTGRKAFVFEELLEGATISMFIVAAEKPRTNLGPLGFERKK